jgi:hypothetical protein
MTFPRTVLPRARVCILKAEQNGFTRLDCTKAMTTSLPGGAYRARDDHRLGDDLLDLSRMKLSLGAFDDFDAGFAVPSKAFAIGAGQRHASPGGGVVEL